MEKFDFVIIGSGPGGYSLALILSKLGKKVAIAERKNFGGSCINEGCVPTKGLVKVARTYELIKNSSKFGIKVNDFSFDWKQIIKRKNEIKDTLNNSIEKNLELNNVKIFKAEAKVLKDKSIEVNNTKIYAEKIIIATGSRARKISFDGSDKALEKQVLVDSNYLLDMQEVPKSIAFIGAGPISLELGYVLSALGSDVTLLEGRDQILANFDHNVREEVLKYLEQKNIKYFTSTKVLKYDQDGLHFSVGEKNKVINPEKIALSVGREANLEAVEDLDLELNPNKTIKVDDKLETSIKGIYALGDVTGKMMLSTIAYKHGDVIVNNLINNKEVKLDYKKVPHTIYLSPEISSIGLSEEEAKKTYGENLLAIKIPSERLPRNHADGNLGYGFFKLIINKDTKQVLGASIILENSSLIINEISIAMNNDLTIYDLAKSPHVHPTLAEALYYAIRDLSFQ